MSDLTRTLLTILAIVLVLLGGSWLFRQLFEQRTRTVHSGFTGAAQRNHLLAAERVLTRGGLPTASIDALDQVLNNPIGNDVLWIATSRETIRQEFAARILNWTAAGGHLIVTAREQPASVAAGFDGASRDWLLDAWQVHRASVDHCADQAEADCEEDDTVWDSEFAERAFDQLGLDMDFDRVETTIEVPAAIAPLTVAFDTTAYIESGVEPRVVVNAHAGPQLMQFSHGRGRVTVLSDTSFWSNYRIDEYDHARFLWHVVTLGGVPNRVWLVFGDDMPPLWRWLWQHAWPVIMVAALMLALAVWRGWPRFGPLRPSIERPRRSLREHIHAAGRWRWRHTQSAGLLAGLREALSVRLAQVHPGWQQLPPEELDRRLAALSGLSPTDVDAALRGQAGADPQRFTRIVQLLSTLKTKL